MRKFEKKEQEIFNGLKELIVRTVYSETCDRSKLVGQVLDAKWFTTKAFVGASYIPNPNGYSYWMVVMADGTMFILQDLHGDNPDFHHDDEDLYI